MSNLNRANRKADDEEIVRLNSVGLSLSTIAKQLNCHPSTITLRLKALGVEPADTRRAFMEEIFMTLPAQQQSWLAGQLGPHRSIKDFVKNLLVEQYLRQPSSQKATNGHEQQIGPSSDGSDAALRASA